MKPLNRVIALFVFLLLGCGLVSAGCDEEKKVQSDPLKDKARSHYREGRRLFLTCDPENYLKAIQEFEDAISYWDDYPEALAGQAEAISMYFGFNLPEQKFQEAYMKSQRAIRLDPELDMGYRAMADLFRHHKNPETGEYDTNYALDMINRAIEKDQKSAENYYVKGSIFINVDPEKALDNLHQARRLNPNLAKTYFNLASAHQIMGDRIKSAEYEDEETAKKMGELAESHFDKAIEYLKTYLTMVPNDIGGYCSLGNIYYNRGEIDNAKTFYEKTLSANPNPDISLLRWRLLALHQLSNIARDHDKDFEAAKLYIQRGLDLAPQNIEFHRMMIDLAEEAGDKKMKEYFEESLRKVIAEKKAALTAPPADGNTAAPEGGGNE